MVEPFSLSLRVLDSGELQKVARAVVGLLARQWAR